MNIRDQVCSLELAIKLKELGVERDSKWYWVGDRLGFAIGGGCWLIDTDFYTGEVVTDGVMYSAFTVSELGDMLPQTLKSIQTRSNIDSKGLPFELMICPRREYDGDSGWDVYYIWWHKVSNTNTFTFSIGKTTWGETEADARAVMLVWLIETEAIKVKEQD